MIIRKHKKNASANSNDTRRLSSSLCVCWQSVEISRAAFWTSLSIFSSWRIFQIIMPCLLDQHFCVRLKGQHGDRYMFCSFTFPYPLTRCCKLYASSHNRQVSRNVDISRIFGIRMIYNVFTLACFTRAPLI